MRFGKGVEYYEFRGGYALCGEATIVRLFAGYRERKIRRKELRVFAAKLEQSSLHDRSKVELSRILNRGSKRRGVKRLRSKEILAACSALTKTLSSSSDEISKPIALSRLLLRQIAQGRLTSSEAMLTIFYMLRRKRQRKRLECLKKNERYARFTYGAFAKASGISKATASRTVSKLKRKGWLNTVQVAKQNENTFGQMFVDGPLISMVGSRRPVDNSRKKAFEGERNDNTPLHEMTTLINYYPKTSIRRDFEKFSTGAGGKLSRSAEFERIKLRAEQMRQAFMMDAA